MASSYVETENSESSETDSGSNSEVENGDLIRLESQKFEKGNLKDELEEEDGVGFIALQQRYCITEYLMSSNLFHPLRVNCNVQYLYLKSETVTFHG
jgi:hypothetical protein